MKKIILTALVMTAALAKADPSYLYYNVQAYDPSGWKNFVVARVGVADSDGATGIYLSNVYYDPQSQTYLTAAYVESDEPDHASAYGWADITDYADDEYSFFVETYGEDGKMIWGYNEASAASYKDLQKGNHIAASVQNPKYASITPWIIPEPSSALLLLLGLAGLTLRRKRQVALALCVIVSSAFTCFGAADDTLISFSTKGPDTYLDGTTVKDGECYALVWTRDGAAFEGLAADGKAVGTNSVVVVFAPVAKGGCCPPVLFELDNSLASSLAGGTYGVYLLDTRLANGVVGGVNAQGVPAAVNGYGKVAQTGEGVLSVTAKSALPAGAPKPQITAIRLLGDNVFLTVKNTLPCLQYAAKEAASLGGGDESVGAAVQGSAAGQITIIAPKKGTSGFYSVDRK